MRLLRFSSPILAAYLALVFLLPGAAPMASARQVEPSDPAASAQFWTGVMSFGPASVDLVVRFKQGSDQAWTGTMDVPIQGLKSGELSEVSVNDNELKFSFQPAGSPVKAEFSLAVSEDGKSAEGTLVQMGQTYPVTLERISEEEAAGGPKRPQTPKPPFPYESRDVTFSNSNDGTALAGTLTIPNGDGPFPAAILLTGSGAQDRDETLFDHKPFAVIADHLTRNGVAVLRWDDRGVGGSGGDLNQATGAVLAVDAASALAYLKSLPEIDQKKLGVIGHSEGAIIAPMAAASNKGVAFIVLLAGPGFPGRDLLIMQYEAILRASGADEESIKAQVNAQTHTLDLLIAGADEQALRDAIRKLIYLQMGGDSNQPPPAQMSEMEQTQVAAVFAQTQTPWFKSFVELDPRLALRKCRSPVLALCGALDLQVPADVNLAEIEQAVRAGGIADVTVMKIEGVNHLFQPAQTGMITEYASIETTIDPRVLEIMTDWIRQRIAPE